MPNIKIYSTPSCPACNSLKKFLTENKIEYENIDVSKDSQKAREMIEKSGEMAVPVIDIDGRIIVGFNETELWKELNIK
ncbi:MAG: thioredoxin family protein [Elusimicrobia bacterium]|nr:thioredoxin family protein [Candidatus Liberimonas magnetica]